MFMENEATKSLSKTSAMYMVGQNVEVEVIDFKTAGFPRVWRAGTVEAVQAMDHGLTDVTVRRVDGTADVQRVGKRGGNRRLRPA